MLSYISPNLLFR